LAAGEFKVLPEVALLEEPEVLETPETSIPMWVYALAPALLIIGGSSWVYWQSRDDSCRKEEINAVDTSGLKFFSTDDELLTFTINP
jgi:hypothetical protein